MSPSRPAMAHEAADVPPNLAGLVKVALGIGASAVALGGTALALCLKHHGAAGF